MHHIATTTAANNDTTNDDNANTKIATTVTSSQPPSVCGIVDLRHDSYVSGRQASAALPPIHAGRVEQVWISRSATPRRAAPRRARRYRYTCITPTTDTTDTTIRHTNINDTDTHVLHPSVPCRDRPPNQLGECMHARRVLAC